MNRTNRRDILIMLTAAAIAPSLAVREARAVTAGRLIAPPPGTMLFQRSVDRQLAGGAWISVTRRFEIFFRHFSDGFIVDGEQVSVDVSAPANLAAFADLERARIETKMFPVTLDPFGQIISDFPSEGRADQVELAFGEALQQISSQPLVPDQGMELRQFVAALHQAGNSLTLFMPFDLFAPSQNQRSENRSIPLPTGDVGMVISRFDAERDSQTGLMRRALREVRTEIKGDSRQTIEHWQLGLN